jgi:hypothetical protein
MNHGRAATPSSSWDVVGERYVELDLTAEFVPLRRQEPRSSNSSSMVCGRCSPATSAVAEHLDQRAASKPHEPMDGNFVVRGRCIRLNTYSAGSLEQGVCSRRLPN